MAELALLSYVRPWRDVVIISIALLAFAAAPALGATVTAGTRRSRAIPRPDPQLTASTGALDAGQRDARPTTGCAATPPETPARRSAAPAVAATRSGPPTWATRCASGSRSPSPPGRPPPAISAPTAVVDSRPVSPTPVDAERHLHRGDADRARAGHVHLRRADRSRHDPAPDTSLPFIDPFPVVRISGRFKGKRTKLTRVTVNAPRGARIRVRCKGRGCPYRRKAIAVKLVRVRALQRTYRPSATIEIRVTQPQKIGKYTRVKTRRGKAPLRIDRCLMPGKTRPVKCPTA